MTRWAAVLGDPVAHSLSPRLHRAAYAALGLDWTYDARRCSRGDLAAFLDRARADADFAGYSLTMPLKEKALGLLDAVDAPVPAVNTVLPVAGRLVGRNTDVDGIRAAVAGLGGTRGPVAVLGAGGTARAAVAALLPVAASVVVVARRPPGQLLSLGVPVLAWPPEPSSYSLVVSTVPAGATDALAAQGWPSSTALVDVVYDPWPTMLAAAALAAGAPVAGGREVLVGQALEQVRLMTGRAVPAGVLHAALAGLQERSAAAEG